MPLAARSWPIPSSLALKRGRPGSRGNGMSRVHQTVLRQLVPWAVPALVLIVWQALAMAGVITVRILPAPLSVAEAGINLLEQGKLVQDVAVSAQRAAIGFFIGGTIGFAFGLLNGFFP